MEGWADLADDLKALSDKAYPTLPYEAREQLAINAYLQQLAPPQVAFSIKQKRPATLDDAVATTLEMESYVAPMPLSVSLAQPEEHPCARVSDCGQIGTTLTCGRAAGGAGGAPAGAAGAMGSL